MKFTRNWHRSQSRGAILQTLAEAPQPLTLREITSQWGREPNWLMRELMLDLVKAGYVARRESVTPQGFLMWLHYLPDRKG